MRLFAGWMVVLLVTWCPSAVASSGWPWTTTPDECVHEYETLAQGKGSLGLIHAACAGRTPISNLTRIGTRAAASSIGSTSPRAKSLSWCWPTAAVRKLRQSIPILLTASTRTIT